MKPATWVTHRVGSTVGIGSEHAIPVLWAQAASLIALVVLLPGW
jgi:hypothetical protein